MKITRIGNGVGESAGMGAADKAASFMGCKSPAVSCPIRTASIFDACEGNNACSARTKTPRLPCGQNRSGRSDRGGKQTRRLEHYWNDCNCVNFPALKSLSGTLRVRRPVIPQGRPLLWKEETGRCTSTARRGMGPSIRGRTRGDNVGKGQLPAGAGSNLQRPAL